MCVRVNDSSYSCPYDRLYTMDDDGVFYIVGAYNTTWPICTQKHRTLYLTCWHCFYSVFRLKSCNGLVCTIFAFQRILWFFVHKYYLVWKLIIYNFNRNFVFISQNDFNVILCCCVLKIETFLYCILYSKKKKQHHHGVIKGGVT